MTERMDLSSSGDPSIILDVAVECATGVNEEDVCNLHVWNTWIQPKTPLESR